MLTHYLTITRRILWRHKGYTLLNVFGLSIGMLGVIMIGLYTHDEYSYDRFHEQAGQLYRIVDETTALTPAPLGHTLRGCLKSSS